MRIPPHPRIPRFYSFTATPTSASITLEYKKNGNLRDYLARHPDQLLLQRMQWCVQATDGLVRVRIHVKYVPKPMQISRQVQVIRLTYNY